MQRARYALSVSLLLLLSLSKVVLSVDPIIVDDTLGDPTNGAQITYLPPGEWNAGPGCDRCSTTPDDLTQVYKGTWHDIWDGSPVADGEKVTATFQFTGTSVSVYGIQFKGQSVPTNLLIFLDSTQVASVTIPTEANQAGFLYNVLYFTQDGLSPEPHTLVIQNGVNGDHSLFLLDYIQYTPVEKAVDTGTTPKQVTSATRAAKVDSTASTGEHITSGSRTIESSGSSAATVNLKGFATVVSSGHTGVGSISTSITIPSSSLPSGSGSLQGPADNTASPKSHTGAITGALVVVIVLLLACVLWLLRRRRNRFRMAAVTPFATDTPSEGYSLPLQSHSRPAETIYSGTPITTTWRESLPLANTDNWPLSGNTESSLDEKASHTFQSSGSEVSPSNSSPPTSESSTLSADQLLRPDQLTPQAAIVLIEENQMLRAALTRQFAVTEVEPRDSWASGPPPYPTAANSVLLAGNP
ncbi:hypothetical protein C8J56DRAFT_1020881 [Mycena floridula]|nr:hypothetical protein C8J56DRAFT_1020881 [Mycena floridula]